MQYLKIEPQMQRSASDSGPLCGLPEVVSCSVNKTRGMFEFQFDPQSAGSYLHLSKNNSKVTKGKMQKCHSLPDLITAKPKTNSSNAYTILGNCAISEGKHYWEIQTGDGSFTMGVAYRSVRRDKDIGWTKKSWGLGKQKWIPSILHDSVFKALAQGEQTEVRISACPERIGVHLDYDLGSVTFTDPATQEVIHTFNVKFEEPVVPAFSLYKGSLSICSD
ncbi:FSD1 [Branchiostoma lanceolatum]|uniref:FSD1 protein n=1 Tax=Branchiostoma lanceolatum TaxID=7740 RepID=A0A8J9YNB9_BRALA|nr:FSD1 [Branchiostoma lanceolatum]